LFSVVQLKMLENHLWPSDVDQASNLTNKIQTLFWSNVPHEVRYERQLHVWMVRLDSISPKSGAEAFILNLFFVQNKCDFDNYFFAEEQIWNKSCHWLSALLSSLNFLVHFLWQICCEIKFELCWLRSRLILVIYCLSEEFPSIALILLSF